MRLALSSAAAADASPQALVAACVRRGLSGIELVHEPESGRGLAETAVELAAEASAADIALVGIHHPSPARDELRRLARIAAAVDAPIVVPLPAFDHTLLPVAAEAFSDAGARLLLAYGGNPELAGTIARLLDPLPEREAIALAWEIRPGRDDPRFNHYVLSQAGDQLAYVRLFGGGPEAHAQTGAGIGSMMGSLALARYSGPLVIAPSSPSYQYAWSAWLGRAGGWGCGSRQSDDALVSLSTSSGAS